jgi:hypothetical protein
VQSIFHLSDSQSSPVVVSDLCRNVEDLFSTRLKFSARKFSELASLKHLSVSETEPVASSRKRVPFGLGHKKALDNRQ